MVWPDLNEWAERLERSVNDPSVDYEHGGVDHASMSAQGFVKLLQELRIIFLQDAALMMLACPAHMLWTHPVFRHEAWPAFALKVRCAETEKETPMEVQIQEVVPLIADSLRLHTSVVGGKVDFHGNQLSSQIDVVDSMLSDFFSGRIGLFAQPGPSATSTIRLGQASASGRRVKETPPVAETSHTTSTAPPPPASAAEDEAPRYTMSRQVSDVQQLWREWHEGLGGMPSIQHLNLKWKNAWRMEMSQQDKMWYSRRKKIIDAICCEAQGLSNPLGIVQKWQDLQVNNRWTLNKLSEYVDENGLLGMVPKKRKR